MVSERKSGPTAPFSKETTKLARNTDAVDLSGPTAVHSRVISSIIRWKAMASTSGSTAVNMTDSGRTISNMAWATSLGKMVENTEVDISVTNEKDTVSSLGKYIFDFNLTLLSIGLMAVSITEDGYKVASMASLSTKKQMAKSSEVSGIMASV